MLLVPSLIGSAFMPGASLSLGRSSVSAPAPVVMAVAPKKIAVGVIGTGLVGAELLEQLESCKATLQKQGLDITVASISKTKNNADGERKPWMLCDSEEGCSLESVGEAMKDPEAGEEGDFVKMADFLKATSEHAIIVDATASEAVSDFYPVWLGKGVHVVTPNKKAGSGDLKRWKQCVTAMEETGAQWGDETTVGAGLPILGTLRTDLIGTGDKVKTIEGIFSGTLSYLFNEYKPGMKFSDVITDAKEKGFTEPDPRDDLSGTDVARKVTIMARACGLEVELEKVPVASLVPDALSDWAPKEGEVMADAFIKEMEAFDGEMEAKSAAADKNGNVLRFVGVVDVEKGTCAVELREYAKTHPFAGTQYADNICAFSTERYQPQPLVVQGPGAGAAVTAAGIFADLIRVARSC
jgi:aspartokinase/homoserine dehydrogenase 1